MTVTSGSMAQRRLVRRAIGKPVIDFVGDHGHAQFPRGRKQLPQFL